LLVLLGSVGDMDLTLRQLRTIREIAHTGSIAAAADQLGYTPSAVSQQVAALERATGVAVLERVGRGVQLTDAGRALVSHADGILDGVEAAAAAVEATTTEPRGQVRLSVFESFVTTCLPRVLLALRADAPEVDLRTTQLEPDHALDALLAGTVDLALVLDYPHAPSPRARGVSRHTLLVEPFRLAAPDAWDLPEPVDLADLSHLPFVAGTPASSCRRCSDGACREAGFEPLVSHELDNLQASLHLVAAGAGLTLVPELALAGAPPGVRTLELATPLHRSIDLCHREVAQLRPSVAAVRDALLGSFVPQALR
jgi:DNA-binding transcriptional LysR family regulator